MQEILLFGSWIGAFFILAKDRGLLRSFPNTAALISFGERCKGFSWTGILAMDSREGYFKNSKVLCRMLGIGVGC